MSHIEIERRFLLKNDNWRAIASTPQILYQGYISVEKECTIRVRIVEQRAYLTLKGYLSDISRSEFEYEIPLADAKMMLQTLCPFQVEKYRYHVEIDGFIFEIDEFSGSNAPLIVAELELPNENADFPYPDWLGKEITHDGRFTNAYLSKHPYGSWEK
ncbi:MAG: CYTH domain-containing protein [Alysiella sp.]|uniref:CYTH domain-containing protein n=1 Tax=Alysiella sp. TaxID=1872483 RepID=UPI0026DB1951|nr:CYTH domain-containing protein [Alysiella sp.]MDO4433181.1 CYTH domain-containing protein [Alysiella sp.]